MHFENPQSEIVALSFQRVAERFGHLGAIREAMLLREDLPAAVRQALVANLSETPVARFVSGRAWLERDRAQRASPERHCGGFA